MYYRVNISSEMVADVVVIGGGTAGVFAAISAARCGAKTVLIEKNGRLGGTMTAAGVNFPGLFFAWGKQIIDGPCWEAIERTVALGGARLPKISFRPERHWHEQVKLNPFIYSTVLFQMCEEAGVHLISNAMISHAREEENEVHTVVTTKDGMILLRSAAAIDATGDATLCRLLGFEMMKSPVQQPASLQNRISGYEMDDGIALSLEQRFGAADLPAHITEKDLIGYLKRHTIDMHILCADADTAEGRGQLERAALYQTLRVVRFFHTIPGLENLTVERIAQEVGVRETNRVVGKHIVTAQEYITGYQYADSVCYAFYPIDLHVARGVEKRYHEENVVSKIPYRALVPQKSRRVLCAGRCVSSDTYANSALRVEAPCMAMGQVAGVAGATMAKLGQEASRVSYEELCEMLRTIGAIVPAASPLI